MFFHNKFPKCRECIETYSLQRDLKDKKRKKKVSSLLEQEILAEIKASRNEFSQFPGQKESDEFLESLDNFETECLEQIRDFQTKLIQVIDSASQSYKC